MIRLTLTLDYETASLPEAVRRLQTYLNAHPPTSDHWEVSKEWYQEGAHGTVEFLQETVEAVYEEWKESIAPMHLLKTRGGYACGTAKGNTVGTADINFVTCPECLEDEHKTECSDSCCEHAPDCDGNCNHLPGHRNACLEENAE